MEGWLIYTREGAERNAFFVGKCLDAARKNGLALSLRYADELPDRLPDFAVVRTMDPALSFFLESNGVRVFNPGSVSERCNDKWETYLLASRLGVPFPETELLPDPSVPPEKPFPYVLKPRCGHGGDAVSLVRSRKEALTAVSALQGRPSLIQKPVSRLGRDLRVYVLGERIIASMLRISETDFRSNFCLGGKAVPYTPDARIREMVGAFCRALPFGLAGIDFLFDGDTAVFNEIEDVVGCRMLYALTDIDPAAEYFRFISEKLSCG